MGSPSLSGWCRMLKASLSWAGLNLLRKVLRFWSGRRRRTLQNCLSLWTDLPSWKPPLTCRMWRSLHWHFLCSCPKTSPAWWCWRALPRVCRWCSLRRCCCCGRGCWPCGQQRTVRDDGRRSHCAVWNCTRGHSRDNDIRVRCALRGRTCGCAYTCQHRPGNVRNG